MSHHIEATLLEVVNKSHKGRRAARIRDHQQQLGPPEPHMIFAHIQLQQIFTHLNVKERNAEKQDIMITKSVYDPVALMTFFFFFSMWAPGGR